VVIKRNRTDCLFQNRRHDTVGFNICRPQGIYGWLDDSRQYRRRLRRRAAPQSDAGEDLAALRISVTTIGDLLLSAADRYPETLALVFPDAQFTYEDLATRALHRARACRRSA
jgi:hypothetical protein